MANNTEVKQIAGLDVPLTTGTRYLATRPLANGLRSWFSVKVTNMKTNQVEYSNPLSYADANEFVNEFNNGSISFLGRVW